jgi:hypothetical protein
MIDKTSLRFILAFLLIIVLSFVVLLILQHSNLKS